MSELCSIASVTVAYNAAHLLPRQLDALLRQSRPLEEIIVVDNASTDGTGDLLAREYPSVTVVRLEKNTGAAGGCAAGWKAAVDRGHDWVWNFDNDSVPGEHALGMLLAGYEGTAGREQIGVVVPLPVDASSGLSYPPLLWRDGLVRADNETMAQPVWFADAAVASGMLLRSEVVKRCELPLVELFMDFFDFEYCLRVRSEGYRVAVVRDCVFEHEIGRSKTVRLLGLKHTWASHGAWREYYVGRNVTYAVFTLYSSWKAKLWLAKHLLRHAGGIVLFGEHRMISVTRFAQGIIDGMRGRLGIRFLPGKRSE